MLPLSAFLLAWLIIMSVLLFLVLFTVVLALRFGLSGFTTYVATAGFLMVIAIGLIVTGGYLTSVNWSQTVAVFSTALPAF